jgi:hypothetical protein
VKAILHAAVNVALLIYCRERNLPHPGIVVLDTPLLTYREQSSSSERVWRRISTITSQAWKVSGNSSSSKTPTRRPTSTRRCPSRHSRQIRIPAATDSFH